MEISMKQQTTEAAWNFYSQMQQEESHLNDAIGDAGNPDYNPFTEGSS